MKSKTKKNEGKIKSLGGRPPKYVSSPKIIICNKCNHLKNANEFYRQKRHSSGYQISCKECLKNYYIKNLDKYKKLKNKNNGYSIRMREYFLRNRDSINSYKRKRYNTLEGKLKVLANNHKRRAQKITTCDGTVTAKSIKDLLIKQNYKCAITGMKLEEYDIDHIIPLSKNGTHSISNIQILLPSVNRSKKDRIL